MRFAKWLACLIVFAAALPIAARGQDQGFESLIEGVLKQHPDDATQPPSILPPTAPQPGAPTPLLPPTAQVPIVPVEPGPRPYTPPKIAHEPEPLPPSATVQSPASPAQAGAPAPGASATAPAGTVAPGTRPGAEATSAETPAVPGAERTRESLTVEEVNAAVFSADLPPQKGASPLVLKAQVLLDRAGASPGVIDAYAGGNLGKALSAVETVLGLPVDGVLDQQVWDALGGDAAPAVLVQYTITPEDAAYPFLASIPDDYAEQAQLPNLNYTSPEEMFGERFHMDTKLLTALNPTANFRQAGTQIWVAAVDGAPITEKVARIVADKTLRQVRAYDAANHLIVAYPATIGSEENPSPFGEHLASAVTRDPTYELSAMDVVQGGGGPPTLPPGPNSPVGTVLIALTDPGYDISGNADPTKVGKPGSHGCVRLTNWDAEELAGLVEPGVVVSFQ